MDSIEQYNQLLRDWGYEHAIIADSKCEQARAMQAKYVADSVKSSIKKVTALVSGFKLPASKAHPQV